MPPQPYHLSITAVVESVGGSFIIRTLARWAYDDCTFYVIKLAIPYRKLYLQGISGCGMKSRMAVLVLLVSSITAIVSLDSCTKRSPLAFANPSRDSTITDTTYFIDFTLGQKRVFEIAADVEGWTWTPPWSIFGDTLIYPFSSLQCELDAVPTGSVYGFYFSKNAYGLDMGPYFSKGWLLMKKSFVDSFFEAGNYSYATLLNRDTTYTSPLNPDASRPRTQKLLSSGIHLIWFDSTGKTWQTSSSSADQTGSYFTITKNQSDPYTSQPGFTDYAYAADIGATFECNLYDGEGHMLHLANGRFHLLLRFKQFN